MISGKRKLGFIFVFISSQVFSQTSDTLLRKYDEQLLYRYGSSFIKGGNKLSFSGLQNEFNAKSPSFDLYKKSKNNKVVSTVLRLVSTVAVVGVVNAVRNNNTNLAYGLLAGQFITGLGSIYYNSKANTNLDRAIQIRNRELLFPGR